ncbi:gluconokinase [Listeria booriae]|uniref:gluconokinase n=1 Tax=Listeria booriae TaxID=1552123 RepID=UPI00162993BE|nr:gluconokinase [Listeria booriae]MBC1336451.1 gluconokinase [Listeria booriae]MBC6164596.1 gluconokinase [Listeria booriae]
MDNAVFVMGVDIGTTSTKAVIFDGNGEVIARESRGYPLLTDDSGMAEQEPEAILDAVVTAMNVVMERSALDAESVKAVAFSAAMHSLIAVDADGKPLTNCITWADNRSSEALERRKRDFYLHQVYEKTGTPIHPMSPFAKICWLQDDFPDIVAKTAHFIGIKSYVLHALFGEYVIDEALASASGLYNIVEHQWERLSLDITGITANQLPKVVTETKTFQKVLPSWQNKLHMAENTIFVVGSSDGALANVGIGSVGEHDVTLTVGTSGAVRKLTKKFHVDDWQRTFCYGVADGYFVQGGAVNNGGAVIAWGLEQFGTKSERENHDFTSFINALKTTSPGANGLLFQPYLLGERAPYWTDQIRGSFIGVTINHKREHFIRAILEGIAFNLAHVYEVISDPNDKIYVTGGISQNPIWCQLIADVFRREVIVPHTIEGSSLGAAILAMQALNKQTTFALPNKLPPSQIYQPNPENVVMYEELKAIFKQMTEQLMSSYERLIDWQKSHLNGKIE